MSHRGPGMDHPHYAWSAQPSRPPLVWPRGAAVAANIVINFEHWELDPPEGSWRDTRLRDPIADLFPAYRIYSWREYGNRIGIFRILDLLDRYGLTATVAANAAACELYPQLVDAFLERRYGFAAHGIHATRMISSLMSEAEERETITASIHAIERATGVKPKGYVGQDFGESPRTPRLVAEAGFDWLMDWPNDDQPYMMSTPRPIVSIPIQAEWSDTQALWTRRIMPWRYPELAGEALEVLRAEGERSGRYFGLHLNPWLVGKPHIFPHLEKTIARLASVDRVWWTTADAVADAFQRR